jgi:CheY-like chemotaxis protein
MYKPHVLIVEDSEDDQMMYAYYLIRKGYHVSTASDGLEALEKALYLAPDVILLDLWLPRMSGWDVIKHLKADKRTKNIAVLVVTGQTGISPWDCDGFLTKPCSLDELGKAVAHGTSARVAIDIA